jgi:hypothetical protein
VRAGICDTIHIIFKTQTQTACLTNASIISEPECKFVNNMNIAYRDNNDVKCACLHWHNIVAK